MSACIAKPLKLIFKSKKLTLFFEVSYVKLKLGCKLLTSLRNWTSFSSPWVYIKNMMPI